MRTFLIVLVCSVVTILPSIASTYDTGRGTYPGALPILAGIATVREDLKLTSLQAAVLDSIRNEYRSEAQQIYLTSNFKNSASLAHAENALRRLQLKYNRRVLSTLNKSQKKKLQQIAIQKLNGFLLLRRPVQEKLSINSAQKVKIAQIDNYILQRLEKINHLTAEKRITPLKRAVALHALRKNSSAELIKVLTPAQKEEFVTWSTKCPPPGIFSPARAYLHYNQKIIAKLTQREKRISNHCNRFSAMYGTTIGIDCAEKGLSEPALAGAKQVQSMPFYSFFAI